MELRSPEGSHFTLQCGRDAVSKFLGTTVYVKKVVWSLLRLQRELRELERRDLTRPLESVPLLCLRIAASVNIIVTTSITLMNLWLNCCILGNVGTSFFTGKKNVWNKNDNISSTASIFKLIFNCPPWVQQFYGREMLNRLLSVCLPGRHHCPFPPGWSSCSSAPDSERCRDGRRAKNNSVSSAARSLEVNYRVGHYSITCVTMTVWSVVYSGGLQGRPSSSDKVPASSVLFTHVRDGGEPSLMACFSWSCRNTKQSWKSSLCPNLSACLIKCHKKVTNVCVSMSFMYLQSFTAFIVWKSSLADRTWEDRKLALKRERVYFKPCVRVCVRYHRNSN